MSIRSGKIIELVCCSNGVVEISQGVVMDNRLLPDVIKRSPFVEFGALYGEVMEKGGVNIYAVDELSEDELREMSELLGVQGVRGWMLCTNLVQKRQLIKDAIGLWRRAGTVGAITRALQSVGFGGATVDENPMVADVKRWGEFYVNLNQGARSTTAGELSLIRELIEAWKPAKAQLIQIRTHEALYLDGSVLLNGAWELSGMRKAYSPPPTPVNTYLLQQEQWGGVLQLQNGYFQDAVLFNQVLQALLDRTTWLNEQLTLATAELASISLDIQYLQTAEDGLDVGQEVQAFSQNLQQLGASVWEPNEVAMTTSSNVLALLPYQSVTVNSRLTVVEERFNSGTSPGDISMNTWTRRRLNTLVADENGITVNASNQVIVPAGIYRVEGFVMGCGVDGFTCRIQNITDSQTLVIGSSGNASRGAVDAASPDFLNTESMLCGVLNLTGTKTLELQMNATQACANTSFPSHTWGQGYPAFGGQPEVFAGLYFRRYQ